jgi:hypothetical protein
MFDNSPAVRIIRALAYAKDNGSTDGAHHKMWVIDQMVRALTGCPLVTGTALDYEGQSYTFERQGESDEYIAWVAAHNAGEDGPNTYEWEVGIAP